MSNDDGTINWVTIKLPETVRDEAQDDPRTYADIMRAGLNADTEATKPDPVDSAIDNLFKADKSDIQQLMERMDEIEAAAREATNAAQNAERAVEEVSNR